MKWNATGFSLPGYSLGEFV